MADDTVIERFKSVMNDSRFLSLSWEYENDKNITWFCEEYHRRKLEPITNALKEAVRILKEEPDTRKSYPAALKALGLISGKREPERPDFLLMDEYITLLVGETDKYTFQRISEPVSKIDAIQTMARRYKSTDPAMYQRLKRAFRRLRKRGLGVPKLPRQPEDW